MIGYLTADAMGGPFFIILPVILLLAVAGAVTVVVLITVAIIRHLKKKDPELEQAEDLTPPRNRKEE